MSLGVPKDRYVQKGVGPRDGYVQGVGYPGAMSIVVAYHVTSPMTWIPYTPSPCGQTHAC